eukprot:657825-Hanusia_phi.AAC.1
MARELGREQGRREPGIGGQGSSPKVTRPRAGTGTQLEETRTMLGFGEKLKEVAAKVEDRLQEKSRSLQSHLQETFEVGGEKSAVQVELEKWQKEAEGILLGDEDDAGTLREVHQPAGSKAAQEGKKEMERMGWGMERTRESPFEERRREDEDADGAPPPGSFSLDADVETTALRELAQDPLFMDEGAMAMAAAALKDVGRKSAGLHSDEEASVYDKVIHMQRRQLEELRKEKLSFEREKVNMETQLRHLQTSKDAQAPTAAAASSRAAEAEGGEEEGDVFHVRLRNPKRIAAFAFIVLAAFALFGDDDDDDDDDDAAVVAAVAAAAVAAAAVAF